MAERDRSRVLDPDHDRNLEADRIHCPRHLRKIRLRSPSSYHLRFCTVVAQLQHPHGMVNQVIVYTSHL